MKIKVARLSKIFAALSSQCRLGILTYIYDRQHLCSGRALRCQNWACIKELAKKFDITVPTASHHIKELVNAGLIDTKRQGKWVFCGINKKTFEIVLGFLKQIR